MAAASGVGTKKTTRFQIPAAPGVAVGWVLIGALVLVFPPENDPIGMGIAVVLTTYTIVFVHFVAELFLGHHMLSEVRHKFSRVLKKEFFASLWMALWLTPAVIPAILYSSDVLNYSQALEFTSRIIQILAFLLGYLVGRSRGVRIWRRLLTAFIFVIMITVALLIESLTHALIAYLH